MTREEAIDVIRKNIQHLWIGADEMTDALEELIPELRETENEKIRTLLVALVQWAKTFNQSGLDPNTANKMLSYLEKQKEQEPAEEIKDQRQIYFMIEDGRRCGVIEGRKQVIDNPEKYGLQEPAEWSEEDVNMLWNIISIAGVFVKYGMDRQKELMMKDAVEVEGVAVWQYLDKHGRDFYRVETNDFTTHGEICDGDKVKVIIVKED